MDGFFSWDGWAWPGWSAIGGIGGAAGLLSLLVSLGRGPRARWALVRIEARFKTGGPEMRPIALVFRNIGDAVAQETHALETLNTPSSPLEQPPTGRLMLAPGDEIRVLTVAAVVDGKGAGRKHAVGEDSLFDLPDTIEIRWQHGRSTKVRSWTMRPTAEAQGAVPLLAMPGA